MPEMRDPVCKWLLQEHNHRFLHLCLWPQYSGQSKPTRSHASVCLPLSIWGAAMLFLWQQFRGRLSGLRAHPPSRHSVAHIKSSAVWVQGHLLHQPELEVRACPPLGISFKLRLYGSPLPVLHLAGGSLSSLWPWSLSPALNLPWTCCFASGLPVCRLIHCSVLACSAPGSPSPMEQTARGLLFLKMTARALLSSASGILTLKNQSIYIHLKGQRIMDKFFLFTVY